jgi:YfiH family protein
VLPGGCDAFITRERGIAVFWAVADCAVVLLVDPVHRAIGLAHAGWRGTKEGIVRNTLDAMTACYETRAADVYAAIGPTIGACCYEVDEPVRRAFKTNPFADAHVRFSTELVRDADGAPLHSLRLDLSASNHAQLLACGVRDDRIEQSDLCTAMHTDLFFSHRKEGVPTGRFAVALGLV